MMKSSDANKQNISMLAQLMIIASITNFCSPALTESLSKKNPFMTTDMQTRQ